MNINLEIEPIQIRLSKWDGYGFSFFGFGLNRHHYAIGFNFIKRDDLDGDTIYLNLFLYGLRKLNINISKKMKEHYICNECGNPVTKNTHYCKNCHMDMLEDEITLIKNNES